MTKWTFEMYSTITEQTTVEAESYKEARKLLDSGDCEWEEVSSEGGELALVSQSPPKSELNPKPFLERLKDAYYKKDDTAFLSFEFTSEPHIESDIEYANRVPNINPPVNPHGIPITYENKDELSAEDIESSRSGE